MRTRHHVLLEPQAALEPPLEVRRRLQAMQAPSRMTTGASGRLLHRCRILRKTLGQCRRRDPFNLPIVSPAVDSGITRRVVVRIFVERCAPVQQGLPNEDVDGEDQ